MDDDDRRTVDEAAAAVVLGIANMSAGEIDALCDLISDKVLEAVKNQKPQSVVCNVPGCRWKHSSYLVEISKAHSVWHVYETHPDVWQEYAGDRKPLDPDPRTDEGLADIISYVAQRMI